MNVDVQQIYGNWEVGYSLDRQTIKSIPIGENEWGHMQFDTTRPEVGEALFQLKYRNDFTQVPAISDQLHRSLSPYFTTASFIVPMPASKPRIRQPVTEIAKKLSILMKIPCYENLLIKTTSTPTMKNISSREEKIEKLENAFTINDMLPKEGLYDVLILDDLFDSGSSLEVATKTLKQYAKIRNVYVATVTRSR